MDYKTEYQNYQIHAYWSKEITDLVGKITSHLGKSYAGQHDLVLKFVNDAFFEGKGIFIKEFRVKGAKYPDLKVPVKNAEKKFEIVELKVHTSQLKYLREELNRREETFSTSDHLYFSYLLQVVPKKGKSILARNCIYYLVIIIISKPTLSIPINELISEIRMGTKHFTEELKEKSEIDEEKEELLGVDNIIKVVDLERKLSEKEHLLEEKETELEKERKLRKERENEIKRLKALLKDK